MMQEIGTVDRGVCWTIRLVKSGVSWTMKYLMRFLWQIVRGPSEGWVTFLLLLLSVMLAVWSVGSAEWVPTPGLYRLAFWGVVLGLLLAKIRFKGWLLATCGILFGFYLSFYQLTSLVEGATSLDRYAEVINRLLIWSKAFIFGNISTDTLPISFFLLLISWLAGFICSWSLFRKRNICGVVLPSGIVIVANLTNLLPGAQRLPLYLYMFITCLLLARLFALEREHDWEHRNVKRLPSGSLPVFNTFWFALALVIVTSLIPTSSAKVAPVAAVWDRVSAPMRVIGEEFAGVMSGMPAKEPKSAHSFGPTQPFRGSSIVGNESVLIVEAPLPVYLRARSYDIYTHQGWETGDTQLVSPELYVEQGLEMQFQKLREIKVNIKMLLSLTAGEPIYLSGHIVDISMDYRLEVLQPARYSITIAESEAELTMETESLPVDLQEPVWRLWEMSRASQEKLTESDIRSALPEDVQVVSCEFSVEGVENFTVERRIPVPPDTVSVRTTVPIAAGSSYQADVSVSAATEGELRAAGTEYPGWLMDRYLQLPDTMPSRVIDLTHELTKDAENPYEKSKAICDYLRTLDYALDIEAPIDSADGVDYFLFEMKKGYCNYFASAMTVLLRASGVPSRMVTGYGPGELMEQQGPWDVIGHPSDAWQDLQYAFVVRNCHSWSEVFFPGYGWIPFEPTPIYPLIIHGELGFPPIQDVDTGIGDNTVKVDDIKANTERSVQVVAISLVLALFGIIMWLGWRRLMGQVSEPRVAYARIGYLAALSGIGPRENLTPHEYGRRLTNAVPEMSAALDKIVAIYVRASYGQYSLGSEDMSNIEKAWPQVRNHLLRRILYNASPFKFYLKRPKS